MNKIRNRNKEIRKVRIGDIVENPDNFRTHSESQQAAFSGAVDELGWVRVP